MALRNPQLASLRGHRVPAWWLDAKLGIFVHWTPASVPAFAPVDVDIAELVQSGRPDALAYSPYAEWYENSLRFPDSPGRAASSRGLRRPPVREVRRRVGSRPRAVGPARRGRRVSRRPARATSCSSPSTWTAIACGRPTFAIRGARVGTAVAMWSASCGEAVRGAGMRFGVYYSGGLDSTFNDRPIGSVAEMLDAVPRGDYPAYAEAQVRELIARYRPSVLWNDIAWPGEGQAALAAVRALLRAGSRRRRERSLDAVEPAARGDALAARAARDRRGLHTPGHSATRESCRRYRRTPTCALPSTSCSTTCSASRGSACAAWTRASATTRASRPEHFLDTDELLWMLTDIVAKGGNLLLNVGPRGVDAQIPDEQLHAARVARRLGETQRRRDHRDPAVGRSRHDDRRGPAGSLHRA